MQLRITDNMGTLEGLGAVDMTRVDGFDVTDPLKLEQLDESTLRDTLRSFTAEQWATMFQRWADLEAGPGVSGFSLKKLVQGVGRVLGGVASIAAPILGAAVGGPVGLAIGQTVGSVVSSVVGPGGAPAPVQAPTIVGMSTGGGSGGGIDQKTLLLIGGALVLLLVLKKKRRRR